VNTIVSSRKFGFLATDPVLVPIKLSCLFETDLTTGLMDIYLSTYGEAPWVFNSSKRLALGTNRGQFVPWVDPYCRAREYLAMNKLVERAYTRRMVMLPCLWSNPEVWVVLVFSRLFCNAIHDVWSRIHCKSSVILYDDLFLTVFCIMVNLMQLSFSRFVLGQLKLNSSLELDAEILEEGCTS